MQPHVSSSIVAAEDAGKSALKWDYSAVEDTVGRWYEISRYHRISG
jgi:hypothetical protein